MSAILNILPKGWLVNEPLALNLVNIVKDIVKEYLPTKYRNRKTLESTDIVYKIEDFGTAWDIDSDKTFQESVDITLPIEFALKYISSIQIVIPNPEELRNYLHRYTDIIELVMSVCEETRNHFILPTQLSLELYRDPEIDDQYLTLYVRQNKYEKDIMNKIEEIRLSYCDVLADKTGYFLLTTDFQFPK